MYCYCAYAWKESNTLWRLFISHFSAYWIWQAVQADLHGWRLRLSENVFWRSLLSRIKRQAANAFSRLPIGVYDYTWLKDDFSLHIIMAMHELANTSICVLDTDMSHIIALNHEHTEVSLETPPTERWFLVEPASHTFCKTTILQVGSQKQ